MNHKFEFEVERGNEQALNYMRLMAKKPDSIARQLEGWRKNLRKLEAEYFDILKENRVN